jgi:tetratricopeptide (TPR) repeat protein
MLNAIARPLLFAATLLLAVGTSCSSTDERDPEELFTLYRESAFYYWQAEDFVRAEAQLNRALEIHDDDLSCNLIMGNIELLKGKTPDLLSAEKRFRSLEQQDDYRVQLGLAQALERLGMAYEDAAIAIAKGDRKTQAPDPAARVDELRKMSATAWTQSIASYQKVLSTKTNLADAINGMQRVLALQGDIEGALVWTNRLIDSVEVDLTYYRSRLERTDITAAEEANIRTRMENSNSLGQQTYLFGASLLHELNRPEAELEYLTRAIEIQPDSPKTWSRRAQAEMSLNLYVEAQHSLDQFLSLSQDPFESPDVQRAYELREKCERALQDAALEASLRDLGAGY